MASPTSIRSQASRRTSLGDSALAYLAPGGRQNVHKGGPLFGVQVKRYKSWVVSYQEVVHAQAIGKRFRALGL